MTYLTHSVLIVGSGGREFALAQKFAEDPSISKIYVVPGNPGMSSIPRCMVLDGDVVTIARERAVDLVVVGPEKPLVQGLGDELRSWNIPVV